MRARLRVALLSIIVVAYLGFGTAYAIKTPAWETPDEPAHFNYIRYLAEHRALPILKVGDYDQAYLEKLKASKFPPSLSIDSVRYESWQPPLYYLAAVPLFWASKHLPPTQQVVVLRLLSVLLGAILLLVSHGVVRRVFPKDDLLALAVPGFIATLPQHVATTAAVNNDTLAEVVIAIILLVLVRRIANPQAPRDSILLGILLGAALLTKTSLLVGVALIPLGLLLHQYAFNHRPPRDGNRRGFSAFFRPWVTPLARQMSIVYGVALAISGWWFVRNALVYGGFDVLGWRKHDLVVQGQPLTGVFDLAYAKFFATWTFKSFWAQFGWMGVLADEKTYVLLGVLTFVAVVGIGLFVLRIAGRSDSLIRFQRLSLLLLGVAFVLVLGVVVAYNFRFTQAQGRYLFPAIVPIAIFFSLGLREVIAERYVPFVFGALYVALLALDYISLTRFILPQLAS